MNDLAGAYSEIKMARSERKVFGYNTGHKQHKDAVTRYNRLRRHQIITEDEE